jgi:hypothetical protein
MTDTVRVYVNSRPVETPAGGTALDAVRLWDPAAADAVVRGTRALTDSRGLPIAADVAVERGAIFRVVHRRERDEPTEDGPNGR